MLFCIIPSRPVSVTYGCAYHRFVSKLSFDHSFSGPSGKCRIIVALLYCPRDCQALGQENGFHVLLSW